MRARERAAAWVLLAPVLAFGSRLAPSHVHHGDADHHGTVHSHLAPHAPGNGHHTLPELEADDDDDVVWLDGAFVQPIAHHLPIPVAVPIALVAGQPTRPSWFPASRDDHAPAHGPPRASLSLRGPPPSCLI